MRIRLGVFLITLSGIIFEVGLTRIYSATSWYHYAFLAVSVALLGWGFGGWAVHLLKQRLAPSLDQAAVYSLLYALMIPACLWLLVRFPFQIDRLVLYLVAPLVPFLLAGMALSTIFDLHPASSRTLYLADLLGASLGAVAVTGLLQLVGGEASLLLAAVAPLVAAACLSPRVRMVSLAAAVVMAIVALSNGATGLFHVTPGTIKAMRRQMEEYPGSRVVQSGWNSYSRIDAVEGIEPPFLARLYIDSDAWTSILPWDGDPGSKPDLRDSYRALPFRFNPGGDTLVIGPGGGTDVVAALASGSRIVTAVELNPLMLQFVRHYGARAGNLYDRSDVEVIQSEGRNFISRTNRKFDTIFLGFVDSWASVASGGLSLSENYLYTAEAFRAYYDHLTDNGVLVILRWDMDVPRLVSNSVAMLGARDAAERIVVLLENRSSKTDPPQMLFMLRKRPFTPGETAEIVDRWTLARPIIVPGRTVAEPFADLLSGRTTLAKYAADAPRFVGPVFDDSPFYFAVDRPWGMSRQVADRLATRLLLPGLVLLAAFAVVGRPRGAAVAPYAASVVYFSCLGFGFIAVELALLQHLTLLLGHPIFTLSILLFTLLAAGGIGSGVSRFVPPGVACLAVAIVGGVQAIALPKLVPVLLPLTLWARVAIAVALVAPLGLVMGMPFPLGLQKTGQGPLPAPPFYWGLNGIMSVIGSVCTVFVALRLGFQAAMLIGCACYLLAAASSLVALREPERAARPAAVS